MKKIIMGIQLEQRIETAKTVQDILTKYGCSITTRLGLHQTAADFCSPKGIILLEMADNADAESDELEKELESVNGVIVKKIEFN